MKGLLHKIPDREPFPSGDFGKGTISVGDLLVVHRRNLASTCFAMQLYKPDKENWQK